jgi:hypothetical protein
MFRHSTNTASFFSVLIAALIFSLSLAGIAWAQGNTSFGTGALQNNTTGNFNTAIGLNALFSNTTGTLNTASGVNALLSNNTGIQNTATGVNALLSNTNGDFNTADGVNALISNTTGTQNTATGHGALLSNTTGKDNTANGVSALFSNTTGCDNTAIGNTALVFNTTGCTNTAIGADALFNNTTGDFNTAIGWAADVSAGNLTNATAIGAQATVNANNKIRLGNTAVTVIEGQVAFTFPSDKTQKENFQPVDGEEVLGKIRGFELSSWNFIGHDPKEFRHYGPMAQDFFAAFGHDGSWTDWLGDHNQLRRPGGDSNDCCAGTGEAHGGAKRERGADCCIGIAAGGAGVAKERFYPDDSREKRISAVTVKELGVE